MVASLLRRVVGLSAVPLGGHGNGLGVASMVGRVGIVARRHGDGWLGGDMLYEDGCVGQLKTVFAS